MKNWYYAFLARIYEGKTTGAVYFVFYIVFYMLFSVLKYGFVNYSIDFITIIQMMTLCIILGLLQSSIFSKHNVDLKRISIWAIVNICFTVFFIEYFNWYDKFGIFHKYIMYILNIIAICMFFISFRICVDYETKRMNKALQDFQSNYKKF